MHLILTTIMGARWSKYVTNNETEAANRLPSLSQTVTIARQTDSMYFLLDPIPLQLFASRNEDIATKSLLPAKKHLPSVKQWCKQSGVMKTPGPPFTIQEKKSGHRKI